MKILINNISRLSLLICFFSLSYSTWAGNTDPPEPWQDTYQGIKYSATSYDWVVVTIEFGLEKPLSRKIEINARNTKPVIADDNLKQDIDALLELGANYIDIGFNTNRMAAEVPFAHINVDKAFAEMVLFHLINIRKQLD